VRRRRLQERALATGAAWRCSVRLQMRLKSRPHPVFGRHVPRAFRIEPRRAAAGHAGAQAGAAPPSHRRPHLSRRAHSHLPADPPPSPLPLRTSRTAMSFLTGAIRTAAAGTAARAALLNGSRRAAPFAAGASCCEDAGPVERMGRGQRGQLLSALRCCACRCAGHVWRIRKTARAQRAVHGACRQGAGPGARRRWMRGASGPASAAGLEWVSNEGAALATKPDYGRLGDCSLCCSCRRLLAGLLKLQLAATPDKSGLSALATAFKAYAAVLATWRADC
jgi:hypothetical protein